MLTIPAMTYDSVMPGPAYVAAATPVRTKMPAPIMAATPNAVRLTTPRERLRRCSGSSACDTIRSIGLTRASVAVWSAQANVVLLPAHGIMRKLRYAPRYNRTKGASTCFERRGCASHRGECVARTVPTLRL